MDQIYKSQEDLRRKIGVVFINSLAKTKTTLLQKWDQAGKYLGDNRIHCKDNIREMQREYRRTSQTHLNQLLMIWIGVLDKPKKQLERLREVHGRRNKGRCEEKTEPNKL